MLNRIFLTLVLFVSMYTIVFYQYVDNITKTTKAKNYFSHTKPRILIFATYRSGSSFIGELFQQNPDVFYMFEPLKMFNLNSSWYQSVQHEGPTYLKNFLNCKFKNMLAKSWEINGDGYGVKLMQWQKRIFCGKLRSRSCFRINWSELERKCRSSPIIVAKEISLSMLSSMEPFLHQGVKVLHLVRDPRGTLSSMKILSDTKEPGVTVHASSLCMRLRKQIRTAQTWIQQKEPGYKLIRYEDVALSTIEKTFSIYKFLGINLPENVTDWISKSTNLKSRSLSSKQRKMVKSSFSTHRNSRSVSSQWRYRLTWAEVVHIQKECRDVIDILGYKYYDNAYDMLTDKEPIQDSPLFYE